MALQALYQAEISGDSSEFDDLAGGRDLAAEGERHVLAGELLAGARRRRVVGARGRGARSRAVDAQRAHRLVAHRRRQRVVQARIHEVALEREHRFVGEVLERVGEAPVVAGLASDPLHVAEVTAPGRGGAAAAGKEEILQRICFRMANEFFEGLETAEKTLGNSTQKLEAAIKSHLSVLTKQPAASAVFQNEWKHLSEPFLSDFLKLRNDYENHFRQIIKEGNASGEFAVSDEKMAT